MKSFPASTCMCTSVTRTREAQRRTRGVQVLLLTDYDSSSQLSMTHVCMEDEGEGQTSTTKIR